MKFTIYKDIITKAGKPITWIEAGEYPVVRIFDSNRVLINIEENIQGGRQLAVVPMYKGQLNIG